MEDFDLMSLDQDVLKQILIKMKKLGQISQHLVQNRNPPTDIKQLENTPIDTFIAALLSNPNAYPNVLNAIRMNLSPHT